MYSKIKRLRRRGERLPDRDIGADPGIVGHVTVVLVENIALMSVHAPMTAGRPVPVIPDLWRARVVTMRGDRMLVQGFERIGDQADPAAPLEKQEWSIQVMVEQPVELATASHRPGT